MTLIPRQEEKHCFIACSNDKVKSGLCDCINRMQNRALNIPDVVGQSEQLCDHPRSERSYIGQNMLRCNKCGKEFS